MRRLTAVFVFIVAIYLPGVSASAEGRWPGVDETVVGRIADEQGRPAKGCLLDMEGDALLFAFLVAGAAGGFVMGYCWRALFPARRRTDAEGRGAP